MGAWWANDPWVWWETLAIVGAITTAVILIIVIAVLGNDERV